MARKQDINVGIIAFTGLVGAILLLIIIWGVEAWYYYEVDLITERHNIENQNVPLNTLKAEHYLNLGDNVGNETIYASQLVGGAAVDPEYRWADESRQVAIIPIHEAMARVAQAVSGQEVTAEQVREADRRFVRAGLAGDHDIMTPTRNAPAATPNAPQNEPGPATQGGN